MTWRLLLVLAAVLAALVATAGPARAAPGPLDCKEAPVPDAPGHGVVGFFALDPDEPPKEADPFGEKSTTTIYEQYGYAGLRWSTYDLGCGPDTMRHPDAVIGTAMSNWAIQPALMLTALTGSLTEVAFEPTFLSVFDPVITRVSKALHDSLFATWIPGVIALVGGVIIFRANRASLATTAAAAGWALMVVMVATALFRWPLEAGHAADETVTGTLGAVVKKLDGRSGDIDPGAAVASNVIDSILYRSWVAGTLGNPDSETAKSYGPELFKASALTWSEAELIQDDPAEGKSLIEEKQAIWKATAEKIQDADPTAYQYLTGERSETRIGYSTLAAVGVFLALPFLLFSSLLLLGCFLIVRLAVMLFPAFATLGAFPAARGLITGIGRTVGAAVVNAIIFGIGAAVTISVLGILQHPGGTAPGWLGLVLMPLFTLIMWVALRPFRRLTAMVTSNDQHFGRAAGAVGPSAGSAGRMLKHVGVGAAASAAGNVAATFAGRKVAEHDDDTPVQDRAEASVHPESVSPGLSYPAGSSPNAGDGFVPRPFGAEVPAMPDDSDWVGDDDEYTIYRPVPEVAAEDDDAS